MSTSSVPRSSPPSRSSMMCPYPSKLEGKVGRRHSFRNGADGAEEVPRDETALGNVERVRCRLRRVAQIFQFADGRDESKASRQAEHAHQVDALARGETNWPRCSRHAARKILNAPRPNVVDQLLNQQQGGRAASAEE